MPIETMIANARVARNKECCPTGFQLAPLPSFAVLIVDTRDNGVLRLDNRFDPLSNCVHLKKKKEEEEEERGNGEKRKEKKRKARYVDTSRVVSFYDRYRRINGPRIETQRTAARDFCRVGEREGEKKEEEKGLLPTGRNMNSRLAYFFRDVRRKL